MGSVGPGQPVVSRPPYTGPQYLSPQGFTVKPSGELRVEHFNRTLLARGHDSMALGESWNMDLPYQWQTLHVGAPMPTIPDGFDAAHFGPGTWVSHRVRGLQVEGWDSFACEYDYQQFNKRMRVRLGVQKITGHITRINRLNHHANPMRRTRASRIPQISQIGLFILRHNRPRRHQTGHHMQPLGT